VTARERLHLYGLKNSCFVTEVEFTYYEGSKMIEAIGSCDQDRKLVIGADCE